MAVHGTSRYSVKTRKFSRSVMKLLLALIAISVPMIARTVVVIIRAWRPVVFDASFPDGEMTANSVRNGPYRLPKFPEPTPRMMMIRNSHFTLSRPARYEGAFALTAVFATIAATAPRIITIEAPTTDP